MKMDEQALEPGTDEIRGKHGSLITLARNINETNGDLQICEHFIPKVFGLS